MELRLGGEHKGSVGPTQHKGRGKAQQFNRSSIVWYINIIHA